MHQITVSEEYNAIRLDAFLAQQEGVFSRSRSQDMISSGYVSINDNTITKLAKKVREGDVVVYNSELFEKQMVAANTLESV
ncbi:MAG: S4 domain-containing protein, partial [Patescibacteria group bacterium]|nr:S4 domain-containing protein [Patescibacteria group bacterium]